MNRMRHSLPLIFLLGLPCLAQGNAAPLPMPASRLFLDEREPRMQLAGEVLRQRLERDFYRLYVYVDLAELKRALAGGSDLLQVERALASGRVSHAYVTQFIQGIGRARRMEFLLENLGKAWPQGRMEVASPSVKRFSAFFDQAVERWAETQVWVSSRGSIYTRAVGKPSTETRDPQLAQAFAATYFGEACMDPRMKRELAQQVQQHLGRTGAARHQD